MAYKRREDIEPRRPSGQEFDRAGEVWAEEQRSLSLFEEGYQRGLSDWKLGVHRDPYVPNIGWWTKDLTTLSLGWGTGQDRMFRQAAEEFGE